MRAMVNIKLNELCICSSRVRRGNPDVKKVKPSLCWPFNVAKFFYFIGINFL